MHNHKPLVYAVVLASGQSRRMGDGSSKLLLPWKGKSLIEHVLTAVAQSPCDRLAVVIPTHDRELRSIVAPYRPKIIFNSNPAQGIGYSLALACHTLSTSIESAAGAVMVILADQPELHHADVTNMINTFHFLYEGTMTQSHDRKIILRMSYRDGRIGHPVLFSHHFIAQLQMLTGDQGGRNVIRDNSQYVLHCHSRQPYLQDIDTPQDYEQLLSRGQPSLLPLSR